MKVQIFADASFCQRSNRAAWAGWIATPSTTLRKSGTVPGCVNDNCHAELLAVSNAVEAALHDLHLKRGDIVVVISDSEHALGILSGRQAIRPDRMADRMVYRRLKMLLDQHGIKVETSHVRGHGGRGTYPTAVNEWCDRAARAELAEHQATMMEATAFM